MMHAARCAPIFSMSLLRMVVTLSTCNAKMYLVILSITTNIFIQVHGCMIELECVQFLPELFIHGVHMIKQDRATLDKCFRITRDAGWQLPLAAQLVFGQVGQLILIAPFGQLLLIKSTEP